MDNGANATKNQKVFITLRSYTELVNEYHRVCAEVKRKCEAREHESALWNGRKNGLEFVFRTLELPMSI